MKDKIIKILKKYLNCEVIDFNSEDAFNNDLNSIKIVLRKGNFTKLQEYYDNFIPKSDMLITFDKNEINVAVKTNKLVISEIDTVCTSLKSEFENVKIAATYLYI